MSAFYDITEEYIKCPQCKYGNLPGMKKCGNCGASLKMADMFAPCVHCVLDKCGGVKPCIECRFSTSSCLECTVYNDGSIKQCRKCRPAKVETFTYNEGLLPKGVKPTLKEKKEKEKKNRIDLLTRAGYSVSPVIVTQRSDGKSERLLGLGRYSGNHSKCNGNVILGLVQKNGKPFPPTSVKKSMKGRWVVLNKTTYISTIDPQLRQQLRDALL